MSRALWVLAVVVAVTPPCDTYLDASMSRHMLVQMPLLAGLGYAAQRIWPVLRLRPPSPPLGAVAFTTGTMLFWMLPRSLDTAVALAWVDQLMHLNMLAAGWSLAFALPRLSFHAKMAFGVYGLAMLLTTGMVYAMAAVPVCATYSMAQQAATGTSLLWLGGALFIILLGRGAYLLGTPSSRMNARS